MSHTVKHSKKEAYTEMYRKNSLIKNILRGLIVMTHETTTTFYIINTRNTDMHWCEKWRYKT